MLYDLKYQIIEFTDLGSLNYSNYRLGQSDVYIAEPMTTTDWNINWKAPDPKSLVWNCENRTNVDVTMSTIRRNNALNDIEQNKLKWIEFLVAFIFKTSGSSYEVSLYRKLMLDSNQGQFLSQFNCGNHFSIRIDPTNAINEIADNIDTKWPNCIFKVFWKSFWSVVISLVIWSMIIFMHFLKYGIILDYFSILTQFH